MALQPHEERVVAEKSELDERLVKLTAFTEGEFFTKVPGNQQILLQRQLILMRSLSEVLGERIDAFPK